MEPFRGAFITASPESISELVRKLSGKCGKAERGKLIKNLVGPALSPFGSSITHLFLFMEFWAGETNTLFSFLLLLFVPFSEILFGVNQEAMTCFFIL